MATPPLAFIVVLLSTLLGTHSYGPALLVAYRQRTSAGNKLLLSTGVYFLTAITIMTATVLVMHSSVAAQFDAIYGTIGDQLWLPKATYRQDMMNISLCSVFAPCPALFSILASGALVQYQSVARSRVWRAVLSGFCILALGMVGFRWTQLEAWNPPSSWHVVSDSAVGALGAAKNSSGVFLTNDLRFHQYNHLPLMNAWAPQLFGQQFYVSNFMFGSYAHPDAVDRLHAQELFWSTSVGEYHSKFLAENHIQHLLIHRDMPFPEGILKAPWIQMVVENTDYYLLRFVDGDRVTEKQHYADQRTGRSHSVTPREVDAAKTP
ncbi:MAG: hypothetical protein ACKVZH_23305 [Blastocatellia bacterium]